MTIEITDAAVAAVKQAMEEEKTPAEAFLRVGVRAGGCSGYSYVLAFEESAREDDRIIEKDGVRVLVDPKSETILCRDDTGLLERPERAGVRLQEPERNG